MKPWDDTICVTSTLLLKPEEKRSSSYASTKWPVSVPLQWTHFLSWKSWWEYAYHTIKVQNSLRKTRHIQKILMKAREMQKIVSWKERENKAFVCFCIRKEKKKIIGIPSASGSSVWIISWKMLFLIRLLWRDAELPPRWRRGLV